MKRLQGMSKIFHFTLRQQIQTKGYRMAVIIGIVLCLLLPAGIMSLIELVGDDDSVAEEIQETAVQTIYTVDLTEPVIADFDFLKDYAFAPFDKLHYVSCDSLEEAKSTAAQDDTSLILVLDENQSGYLTSILLPENTSLTETDADGIESFILNYAQVILLQKSGLQISQLSELMIPVHTGIQISGDTVAPETAEPEADTVAPETTEPEADTADMETADAVEEDEMDALLDMGVMKEIFTYVFTFMNVIVIYFLVLFYGQAVANNVVMEKTSKLMDTFLISVRPEAMVFGKVLAIALSSVLQFGLWLVSLFGGFALGSALVRLINPESDMLLLDLFALFGEATGFFSVSGVIVALLILVAGFFLYCSLAAIGAAMAGKTEDLASTNMLFSLVLVISFLCVLYSGGLDSLGTSNAAWQNWIPFMSILVTPARVLMGQTTVLMGLASLAVTIAVTALLLYIAGRIYKMMALYRGKVPNIGQVLRMLKG